MEKHPISPGELQPAWELLGDLLLAVGEPAGALEAYEASLQSWPRRDHTLLGAARSAEELGEAEVAERYREELAELAEGANSDREGIGELQEQEARQG